MVRNFDQAPRIGARAGKRMDDRKTGALSALPQKVKEKSGHKIGTGKEKDTWA
jgi:hypothetical protein